MKDRTRNQPYWTLLLLLVAGIVALTDSTAFGLQIDQSKIGPTPIPSPLSSFDIQLDVPKYHSDTIHVNAIVTHEIDLREILGAYAAKHRCTSEAALNQLVTRLGMSPVGEAQTETVSLSPQHNALYRLVGNDVYSLTAKQGFFNLLQTELNQFPYGNKVIVVELRTILLPKSDVVTLQSFMIPNTFEVFGNRLPVVDAIAANSNQETATFANHDDAGSVSHVSAATFVSATETKTKAYPTFIGHLNPKGYEQLKSFSKSRSAIEFVQAQTVTMFPGQAATVSALASRPFVVSVNRVEHEKGTAFEPVIQILEDGMKLALRADEVSGKVKLSGDLAFSKVTGVETFEYSFANEKAGKTIAVQVPEHHIRRVHWSTEIESGNSILIDTVETVEKEIKPKTRLKKAVTKTMRQLILITLRVVEQNAVVVENPKR